MNDFDTADDDRIGIGGSQKGGQLGVVVLVVLALAAGAYYWFFVRTPGVEPVSTGQVAEVPQGSKTVSLYFADNEDPVLFTETRQVAIGRDFVEQVDQVIRALILGPEKPGVSTLPKGTQLLSVFYDSETFTVYLDLSSEFIAGHPGGSSAEYFTVSALMKTISDNFPEVQAVQLLVEGSQVSTIAGHINAYKPLPVRDWR